MIGNEFIIEIVNIGNGGFHTRVRSPAGEATGDFKLPFTSKQLEDYLPQLGIRVYNPQPNTGNDEKTRPKITNWNPREIGIALFEALFKGPILRQFDRSLGTMERKLEIKLKLDPKDPYLNLVSHLPWELMCSQDSSTPLGLRRSFTFSRYLELPRPLTLPPITGPKRLLAIIANPEDTEKYEAEKVHEGIRKSWTGNETEIEFLEDKTLDGLREKFLNEGPFHILHFTGHGGMVDGDWVVAFEKKDGSAEIVSGETLAATLVDAAKDLHLVTLMACESGKPSHVGAFNPYKGVAHALVHEGVPAVLAMQFPISLSAAFTFTPALYRRLVKKDPLDVAVNEARHAVYRKDPNLIEWATPVLFMRPNSQEILCFTRPDEGPKNRPPKGAFQKETSIPEAAPKKSRESPLTMFTAVVSASNLIHQLQEKTPPSEQQKVKTSSPDYPSSVNGGRGTRPRHGAPVNRTGYSQSNDLRPTYLEATSMVADELAEGHQVTLKIDVDGREIDLNLEMDWTDLERPNVVISDPETGEIEHVCPYDEFISDLRYANIKGVETRGGNFVPNEPEVGLDHPLPDPHQRIGSKDAVKVPEEFPEDPSIDHPGWEDPDDEYNEDGNLESPITDDHWDDDSDQDSLC